MALRLDRALGLPVFASPLRAAKLCSEVCLKVDGKHFRSVWLSDSSARQVCVIDQRLLPHHFKVMQLQTVDDVRAAIADMVVRGAPLIGVVAAYGMYLAATAAGDDDFRSVLQCAAEKLINARPTAVNLEWAVLAQLSLVEATASRAQAEAILLENARRLADEDAESCRRIGEHALQVIRGIAEKKRESGRGRPGDGTAEPVQILTHCNAGWLATVDWGTATSAMYQAFDAGIPLHVWVDETRPRNQGAALTAWELGRHGVPYTLITDNAGGHLMQNGMVDMVIVGTDRTTRGGDVANKIGTYLKALAAHANGVPFYVAAPSSSIDWQIVDGSEIPIEERSETEVKFVEGLERDSGATKQVLICPEDARVANFGFDVTPRHLVTGLITERGICEANETALLQLFPEQKKPVTR